MKLSDYQAILKRVFDKDKLEADLNAPTGILYGLRRSTGANRLSGMRLSTGYTPPIWPAPFVLSPPPDTLPCLPQEPAGPPKTGFICTKCGDKNDFAQANQPDGTYQCSYHFRSL